ncbi:MAG: PKD domain-containing protein [Planctomycetes bacterium]|nr:PKD domain-containing protein [Planctomycetota bacterium]
MNTRMRLVLLGSAFLIGVGLLAWVGCGAGDAAEAPTLSIVGGCPAEDGEAAGVVVLQSSFPIDAAYQVALRFDRSVADLVEFSVAGTAGEGAGFASSLVGSDAAGDYASLGVLLLDLDSGSGSVVPAGSAIPIARVRFRPADPSIPQVPLAFEEGIAGPSYSPARNLLVVRNGATAVDIIPNLAPPGSVTVARMRLRSADRTGSPGATTAVSLFLDSTLPVRGLRCGFRAPESLLEFLGVDSPPGLGSACHASVQPGAAQGAYILEVQCAGPPISAGAGVTVAVLRFRIADDLAGAGAWPERIDLAFDGEDPEVRPATPALSSPYGECGGVRIPAIPAVGVCVAPRAQIQASPASGAAPLSAALGDRSLGVVRNRTWDFGDGQSLADGPAECRHTFGPGRFVASLTVRNACGEDRAETTIESRIRVEFRASAGGPADDPPGGGHRAGETAIPAARLDIDAGLSSAEGIVVSGLRLRSRVPGDDARLWVARAALLEEGGAVVAEGRGFGADGALRLLDRVTRQDRVRMTSPGTYRVEIDLAATADESAAAAMAGPLALLLLAGAIATVLLRAARILGRRMGTLAPALLITVTVLWFAGCSGGGGGGGGAGAPAGAVTEQGIVALELAWDGVEWESEAGLADAGSLSLPCAAIRVLAP